MLKYGARFTIAAGLALLLVVVAAPAYAAGFGIFEHGAKGMGTAGAFTGQADDGSALFHNVAGIGFQKERSVSVGTTFISLGNSEFTGAAPFPGPTATAQQKDQILFPSHAYYIQPISSNLTFGAGFNNPFGLVTEWDNPDTFAGRFLSTKAELTTYDLSANLGWEINPQFSLGFGVIGRLAEITLERRAALINPFTSVPAEVAEVHLESDLESGFGWTVGLLHKYNNSFSWGLSYRSSVDMDFGGEARFTQVPTGNPQFDAGVAAALPFGSPTPIATNVEFPDMASLGFSFALSPVARLNLDVNWTGWSSFDRVDLGFPQAPLLDQTLPENWEDVYNYRIGLAWGPPSGNQWRFGFVYDETPQPDETVSPLLPDADRLGYTIGYGWVGTKRTFDVALMYLDFEERSTSTNVDNFNGTYDTDAILLGLTLGL